MKSSISSKGITERDALRVLNAVSGLGNRRITRLLEYFGSATALLAAPSSEVPALAGMSQAVALNLRHFPLFEFLERDDRALATAGGRVVTFQDEEYPAQLKAVHDAPVVLYVYGTMPSENDVGVAIVGARNATIYGLELAERFAMELAERGVWVISGLARGIDTAAHRGALKASGRTVGVLGCGLDIVYPAENDALCQKMRAQVEAGGAGGIISEFPCGTLPAPFNFPRRNRIVSGLSRGVLVVEANIKSGALITAAFAAEQGREVFAVPGRVDSLLSIGPHALIRQGAKLTVSIEDILEELPIQKEGHPAAVVPGPVELDEGERRIFSLIQEGLSTLEQLEERTGWPPALLMGPLLALQIKRLVKELPGKSYCLYKDS